MLDEFLRLMSPRRNLFVYPAAAIAVNTSSITVLSFRRKRSLFYPMRSDVPAGKTIAAVIIASTVNDMSAAFAAPHALIALCVRHHRPAVKSTIGDELIGLLQTGPHLDGRKNGRF
jgi:hypothetical protein